ncbi:hypothetical protein BDV93DRAFT_26557 [Ceratobasidium sp. AG-I]|nr:hypothetical protein BDV93DRAFT_26557 [Ceratobasidium sp. AG-I]
MRHSVGSSADVLLTPIRGSTVIADDFVFLPTSHAVEIGEPDELASSSGYETPESPGPTITTLLTESEIHYGAERESLGSEAENLGPDANMGGLVIPNNKPDGELRPSDSSFVLPEPPTPETPTVANPIFKHRHTRLATPPEPAALASAPPTPKPSPPPVIEVVKCPVPRAPLPTPPPTVRAPSSTRQSAKNVEPRNVVPFPVGRPQSIAFSSTDAAPYSPPSEIYQHPLTVWIFAAWDTTTGIIILAMECYRWLARKGMRGDFRSCMSVWFLREITLGLFLPLLLAAVTLWWLLRTSYPSDSLSSMSV